MEKDGGKYPRYPKTPPPIDWPIIRIYRDKAGFLVTVYAAAWMLKPDLTARKSKYPKNTFD